MPWNVNRKDTTVMLCLFHSHFIVVYTCDWLSTCRKVRAAVLLTLQELWIEVYSPLTLPRRSGNTATTSTITENVNHIHPYTTSHKRSKCVGRTCMRRAGAATRSAVHANYPTNRWQQVLAEERLDPRVSTEQAPIEVNHGTLPGPRRHDRSTKRAAPPHTLPY